jgi:hypothetical protein
MIHTPNTTAGAHVDIFSVWQLDSLWENGIDLPHLTDVVMRTPAVVRRNMGIE